MKNAVPGCGADTVTSRVEPCGCDRRQSARADARADAASLAALRTLNTQQSERVTG